MRYTISGATVEQVQQGGGTDIKATRNTGHIFATLTAAQATQLQASIPGVRLKEVGAITAPRQIAPSAPIVAEPTYTLQQLNQLVGLESIRQAVNPPLYGDGFNLAIIDTGIRESHELINGRVVYRQNFTADPMEDGFDHGTGVASIAVSVAPHCNILNIKVMDNSGSGTDETVVSGIDDVISLQETNPSLAPSVINLSLGGEDDGDLEDPVRVACRTAINKGIWVVAGAGNAGPDAGTIDCPACEQYVLAIGSVKYLPDTNSFAVSNFSSRGPTKEGVVKPDVVLFGEGIIVASSQSDMATAVKSGTSFASPFGAAIALLYLEGVNLRATALNSMGTSLPATTLFYVPEDQAIEDYLPGACLKPSGAPVAKDDAYGNGLPFGPLMLATEENAESSSSSDTAASLMEQFTAPLVGMVMMGLMMKQVF